MLGEKLDQGHFENRKDTIALAIQHVDRMQLDIQAKREKVAATEIRNQEEAAMVAAYLTIITSTKKEIITLRDALLEPSKKEQEEIKEYFRPTLETLRWMEETIKNKGEAYWKRIKEEARKEEERLALKAAKEQERILGRAREAAEKGNTEKAAELQEKALMVTAPKIQSLKMPKGMTPRETWTGEVTDIKALILFAAQEIRNQTPIHNTIVGLFKADSSALNKLARSTSGTMEIPGIRFAKKASIANI